MKKNKSITKTRKPTSKPNRYTCINTSLILAFNATLSDSSNEAKLMCSNNPCTFPIAFGIIHLKEMMHSWTNKNVISKSKGLEGATYLQAHLTRWGDLFIFTGSLHEGHGLQAHLALLVEERLQLTAHGEQSLSEEKKRIINFKQTKLKQPLTSTCCRYPSVSLPARARSSSRACRRSSSRSTPRYSRTW